MIVDVPEREYSDVYCKPHGMLLLWKATRTRIRTVIMDFLCIII